MGRKVKFFALISLFLVLVLLDGLLTYINTPDLKREANPLVSVFGLGWGTLFIANLIGFILVFVLARYNFVKYETIVAPVTSWQSYVSQIFYNRPDKFKWTFYKLPKNWKPVGACLGYVLLVCGIFHRVLMAFQWLTTDIRVPVYDDLRRMAPYGRLDVIIILLLVILLMLHWLKIEYKKSSALVAETDDRNK